MRETIFIGCPTHDNRLDANTAERIFVSGSKSDRNAMTSIIAGSLINMACNALWCQAHNVRESNNVKWFVMLHSDCVPDRWWIDTLIEEAEKHDADIMSAVIPIKDVRGLTSTAIAPSLDPIEPWLRVSLRQLNHPDMPGTFDIDTLADALEVLPEPYGVKNVPRHALMVNTGCMVARLDRDWSQKVHFAIKDEIRPDPEHPGQIKPYTLSEDWCWSLAAAAYGARVFATRAVRVTHKGIGEFSSAGQYGTANGITYPTKAGEQ